MLRGLITNIQKFSLHDGPGIRTTVFLKGCPLQCAWCHNPEGLSRKRELMVLDTRCIKCGECREACPHGDTFPRNDVLPSTGARCELCGACVEACPTGARRIIGQEMTVSE